MQYQPHNETDKIKDLLNDLNHFSLAIKSDENRIKVLYSKHLKQEVSIRKEIFDISKETNEHLNKG